MTDQRSPVQSVDRALEILEHLAHQGEAGVVDIAAHLGVHKSTAFRLLAALHGRGLVDQPGDRMKYRLGTGLVRLAGAVPVQRDVVTAGRRACEELAEDFGVTVNVAVADGGAAVNIDQVRGGTVAAGHNWTGERTPLHATSSGKVLLAFDDALTAATLRQGLTRYTSATITGRVALTRELARVREEGRAVTREELELGLLAVAAPVRNRAGAVVAAISAAGPASRIDEDRLAELGKAVVEAADTTSQLLGWHPAR